MDGVREYHTTVLKDIEIVNKTIALPPKVRLSKDDINILNAQLNTFTNDTHNHNPLNILQV